MNQTTMGVLFILHPSSFILSPTGSAQGRDFPGWLVLRIDEDWWGVLRRSEADQHRLLAARTGADLSKQFHGGLDACLARMTAQKYRGRHERDSRRDGSLGKGPARGSAQL